MGHIGPYYLIIGWEYAYNHHIDIIQRQIHKVIGDNMKVKYKLQLLNRFYNTYGKEEWGNKMAQEASTYLKCMYF